MLFVLKILLLFFLVAFSAFFSSAEISLFSLPRAKVLSWKESPDGIQRIIYRLMDNYNRTLVTIILGNMFVNSAISMLNDSILKESGLTGPALAVLSACSAIILLLLFGEITPMSLAYVFCDPWSRVAAMPVLFLRKILSPVVCVMDFLSGQVLDLLGRARSRPLTADEYDSYMEICGKKGAFTQDEVTFLREALDFAGKDAGEVMRPRNTLGFLPDDASSEFVSEQIRKVNQRFMLVGKKGPDDADRIFDAIQFFMLPVGERERWKVSPAVIPALFIPEDASVMHAVRTLRAGRSAAGLVADEYGGISGLVSADELFMHLAADEKLHNRISEYGIEQLSDTLWNFDGSTPLDIVEEKLGISFDGTESKTLNGFLLEQLGRIPAEGDFFEYSGYSFKAMTVTENHADCIQIEKSVPAKEAES